MDRSEGNTVGKSRMNDKTNLIANMKESMDVSRDQRWTGKEILGNERQDQRQDQGDDCQKGQWDMSQLCHKFEQCGQFCDWLRHRSESGFIDIIFISVYQCLSATCRHSAIFLHSN